MKGKGTTLRRPLAASVAALVTCAGALAGAGFVGTGVAAATTAVPTGTISAPTVSSVPSTGTGKTAGSITIGLSSSGSLPSGETLQLLLSPSTGSGVVDWSNYSVKMTGISYTTTTRVGNALNIVLGAKSAGTAATVHVTGVKVTTSGARGSVVVTPTLQSVTFAPATATIATLYPTPPAPPAATLSSTSEPQLSPGETSGSAGSWTLTLSGTSTAGSGWNSGDAVVVTVAPPSGTNCAGDGYLAFSGTPTASVVSSTGVSVTPSVADSVTNGGPCGSPDPNELEIQLTNSVWFESSGSVRISITGVRYTVGPTAGADGAGPAVVSATYLSTTVTAAAASNAFVGGLALRADTPPVSVVPSAFDAPISPVEVVESSSAHVQPGYVCLALGSGTFNPSVTPTASVVSGNGSVVPAVSFGGTKGTGPTVVEFQVTAASTTAGTYGVSGLTVDAPATPGQVSVHATEGPSANCANDTGSIGSATAYGVTGTALSRVYGATADATAAAELEHQFGASGTGCPGRPGARPVVLATDANYRDALASAYLASYLGTGELLTPTSTLSAATVGAIRLEGITTVYIVGGPLAVSNTVAQQLEAMTADTCGGAAPLTTSQPVHLEVDRIWGQTAYDTAQWVADYPPASNVGTLTVPGAYVGTDATGGTGRYNDTAGNGSPAPATSASLPTAIVATGGGFQDAESASALSYAAHLPILLTTASVLSPEVASAITALQVKQVIVMGGQLAVSDAVVASLEKLGVNVLRIAGRDDTDTAVQLADFELGPRAGEAGLGWAGTGGLTVARGDFYSDGLAGAVVAAGAGATHAHSPEPLVLTEGPSAVGAALTAFLHEAGRTGVDAIPGDRVSSLTLLGGPLALAPGVVTAMSSDL
jgi:putative cell wall-binding protein